MVKKAWVSRIKKLGLPLAAAALTAVAFAAVSMAAKDDGSDKGEPQGDVLFHRAAPPPSEEDQAKLEEFRECMKDNGAPAPPAPPSPEDLENLEGLEDGQLPAPPEPPTEEERNAIDKALEACDDVAPEGFGMRIGPGPGGPCGPPPGAPGVRADREGDQS